MPEQWMPRRSISTVMACVLLVCSQLLSCCTCTQAATVKLALLSDVHYDPAFGTALALGPCTTGAASDWGTPNCDAPLNLVSSAIHDAALQDPDLMLMSGDWLRHSFNLLPISEATPTFETVATLLSDVMPQNGSNVFAVPNFQGALGNNDFIPDYHFNLANPSHPLLLNQSMVLGRLNLLSPVETTTFGKCGYYARDVRRAATNASSGLRVVVLNTILYSMLLDPPLPLSTTDPCGQLAFLNTTLNDCAAKGHRAVIVAHIPPGMNLFGVLSGGTGVGPQSRQFWREDFVTAYRAIVAAHAPHVAFQYFGHTHMFSVIADAALQVPGIIVPSVTRLFGNMPSYLIAEMDETTWALVSVRQRYLVEPPAGGGDAPYWATSNPIGPLFGPSVFSAPPTPASSGVGALATGCKALVANDTAWAWFQRIHEGGTTVNMFPTPPGSTPPATQGQCNAECKQIVLCSMLHVAWADIAQCLSAPMPTNTPQTPTPTGSPPTDDDDDSVSGGFIAMYVMCALVGTGLIALVGKRLSLAKQSRASEGKVLIPSAISMEDDPTAAHAINQREGTSPVAGREEL